jgi:hypothetical protein
VSAQVVAAGLDRPPSKGKQKEDFMKPGLSVYGPLLLLLPADELTVIALHSAIRDLMTGPISFNST